LKRHQESPRLTANDKKTNTSVDIGRLEGKLTAFTGAAGTKEPIDSFFFGYS